ncbi:MAG: ATP-binding protein, partial [Roseimicrobium sp.]
MVTGLPGSGKSTSLSEFFDDLESDSRFAVCRYFCFVSPNEDAGRLRLEAEALRVNLLSELHRQFRDDLERRHDYSEHRFTDVLAELGEILAAEHRKLVILLDGLDHAERDHLVRDSVLRALPVSLPRGVVVVVGTQELKNWQPLALSEGREGRHVPIPLFTLNETRAYLVQKHALSLDESWIERIHAKSQGLPLYLRYVAEWLRDHEGDPATLAGMPEGGDGDIRKYYERLWSTFDQTGMSHGRHLCAVLTVLKFPVHENELADFQKAIPSVD